MIGPNVGCGRSQLLKARSTENPGKHLEDVLILMGFRNVLSALRRGLSATRQGIGRALDPACGRWCETLPAL